MIRPEVWPASWVLSEPHNSYSLEAWREQRRGKYGVRSSREQLSSALQVDIRGVTVHFQLVGWGPPVDDSASFARRIARNKCTAAKLGWGKTVRHVWPAHERDCTAKAKEDSNNVVLLVNACEIDHGLAPHSGPGAALTFRDAPTHHLNECPNVVNVAPLTLDHDPPST